LKYLFLPGSVSLFVLLQFLQETYTTFDSGAKISNLVFALHAKPSSSDLITGQWDVQQQLIVLILANLFFLVPPMIWAYRQFYTDLQTRRAKSELKHNEGAVDGL
jgi:TRAP-type mannitol/chloroaromatic compound transport system permease small subunit